jgi:hypothetical protein
MVLAFEARGEAMEFHLIIKPIGPDQVAQAYPLVQAVEPGLTLERWRTHVRALTGGGRQRGTRGGIMSLQDARGYIHGLFAYDVADDSRCGRRLHVGTVVAFHPGKAEGTARQMIRAIETVARQHGCSTIQISQPIAGATCPHRPGMVASDLEAAGFRPAFVTWCKFIPASDESSDGDLNP